jgi:hypothetical protein
MLSVDLYIIAAGTGSRINASAPKALTPIVGEPCITTTLRQIGAKFRKVFVVTNVLAWNDWYRYFRRLEAAYPNLANVTENLPIKSGLGDGHASLQGLIAAEGTHADGLAEEIVVAWGDVFIRHGQLIDELLASPMRGSGLFPVVYESSPYVSLLVNEAFECVSVDFSKYGEGHKAGFHDQSVFRFVRSELKRSLLDLHGCLWKGGRYMTAGSELSLLYSVHQLYNSGRPVCAYETRYPTLSFNTIEEVVAIRRELGVLTGDAGDYPQGR